MNPFCYRLPSPYMARLSHTHIVPAQGNNMPMATQTMSGRVRPFSAVAAPGRPKSGYKPKMDPRFIADPDQWEAQSTPRIVTRRRPQSAPVYRR